MGNVLLLFVLACAAYVVLPACQNAFRMWSYSWGSGLNTVTPPSEHSSSLATVPVMPEALLAYVSSWGDQWAREDAMERAKRLYLKHANWELVYQELLSQDGEELTKING